jgi:hypothetical protein
MLILGRRFKVKYVGRGTLDSLSGDSNATACTDFYSRTILIDKSLPKHEKRIALFHEATHCAQHITGLNQVTTPEMQEIWCETMANLFEDLLREIK